MAPISIPKVFDSFTETWSPRLVASVNNQDVKIAKLDGAFVFHAHPDTEELFYLISGQLTMEIEGGQDVIMSEGDVYVVPRGVRHRPVARDAKVMMVETAGTVNTGDAPTSERTKQVKVATSTDI